MKKFKNAFTLIELLAVIIILAVVAVIATPKILEVIDNAKDSVIYSKLKIYSDSVKLEATKDYIKTGAIKKGLIDTTPLNNSNTSCEKSYYLNDNIYLENCIVDGKPIPYYDGEIKDTKPDNWDSLIIGSGDGTLIGDPIATKVLEKYPYLALADTAEKGCATLGDNNYTYMGGCYLKGLPTENYLWFNGFMYRIMGINKDGSIKMITEENVAVISWGAKNTAKDYANSYVKKWLNEYFLENTDTTLNSNIVNGNFCFGAATTTAPSNTICNGTTFTDKAGLISIDEYNLAGSGSSYLKTVQDSLTSTPYSVSSTWIVDSVGKAINYVITDRTNGVRPVINVNPATIITAGDGTINTYFVLGETKGTNSGTLLTNAKVGEYVTYASKTYRVVENSSNGTKLILDGFYSEKLLYGTEGTTVPNCTLCTNADVLNYLVATTDTENMAKLTNTTWYRGNAMVQGNDYSTTSLVNTNSYIGNMGLIRMGEMLSGISETMLNPIIDNTRAANSDSYNYLRLYWLATPCSASSAWSVHAFGSAYVFHVNNTYGVRPVINVDSSSTILGGNGTPMSSYQI